MEQYLAFSEYIDWDSPAIVDKAQSLVAHLHDPSDVDIAQACFVFVRDQIKHSWDYQLNPITCKASDVLLHGTGFCYAKSHLLAALLRAHHIPAGLCYQRLTVSDDQPPFCLHGLNAVYLRDYGWYRMDPRGNKVGVRAEFSPPNEQLAFPIMTSGEADLPEIWSEPLAVIVTALNRHNTYQALAENLPDIELLANKESCL